MFALYQFDFYDGGGLDMCFLGAAQISPSGDVNVSRLCKDNLIGPGGFVDISQSTRNISFLCTFTAKGLKIDCDGKQGSIKITNEGSVRKFVNEVYERTFSGEEAVRRGQKVYYVTERAVFRRTAIHPKIELVEIAPGVDLQKDVLDQMVGLSLYTLGGPFAYHHSIVFTSSFIILTRNLSLLLVQTSKLWIIEYSKMKR